MKVYISGPISGTSDYHDRFLRAAEAINGKGHEAVNPLDLGAILKPWTTTWEQYMVADLGLLRACEAAYFMPGWGNSTGAKIEHGEAVRRRLKIYYDLANLEEVSG